MYKEECKMYKEECKILIEDKDNTLQYILEETLGIENTTHCFLLRIIAEDGNIFYGRLDVEQGTAEQLDDHCEQCFNQVISWIAFKGDNKLCGKYLTGIVGLNKYNHFKKLNQLGKILGDKVEIIEIIK